ncbi:MAG: hypothetical protein J3T61_12955, partial [Candidatus Brocadiales bacterium]|nr:hypothetical protein [Candidatus Bathyanammoxibius sp.]
KQRQRIKLLQAAIRAMQVEAKEQSSLKDFYQDWDAFDELVDQALGSAGDSLLNHTRCIFCRDVSEPMPEWNGKCPRCSQQIWPQSDGGTRPDDGEQQAAALSEIDR